MLCGAADWAKPLCHHITLLTRARSRSKPRNSPQHARTRFLFYVPARRPTVCASPAPRSAAERRQVQARVGQAINHSMTIPPVQPNASANQMTKVCKHSGIRGQMLDFYFAVGFQPFLDLLKRLPINFVAFFQHLCSMPDSVIVILK
jgi:hypothetical protein